MSMSFQSLENMVLELFASVVDKGDPMVGLIIGSQLPFGKLCGTAEALLKHRSQDSGMNEECVGGGVKVVENRRFENPV